MKKILFAALALLLAQPAHAVIPFGSCIAGLKYNSTGAAGANTTAINNALAAGGHPAICGNPSAGPLWVNASLVIPSYTWLSCAKGTHIETVSGTNASVLVNATQSGSGNSWVAVDGCWFDGNQANNTGAEFATVWMYFGDHYFFWNDRFDAGQRLNAFPNGTFGEGLRLHDVSYSYVWDSDAQNNIYDGFKVVGNNTTQGVVLENLTSENNSRCGVQIGFDNYVPGCSPCASTPTASTIQQQATVSGLTVTNTSATPVSSVSPETCGVYVHGGQKNTITNVSAYQVNQLFGTGDDASYNDFSNSTGFITSNSANYALANEAVDATHYTQYNKFSNIVLHAITGASKPLINLNGLSRYSTLQNISFDIGGGSGTWTTVISSSALDNQLNMITAPAGGMSVSDSGTGTILRQVDTVGQSTGVKTLTVTAAAVSTDASLANAFYFVAPHSATTTINNPTNAYDGQKILYEVQEDSTGGSAVLAYGNKFSCGAGLTTALSSGANKTDILGFYWSKNLGLWLCTGTSLNN